MPFRQRIGQDIFKRKIRQTYENCKGVVEIADDVQVFGNVETHDRNFEEAIECMIKQALAIVLINVLLRPKVIVSFGNQYTPEGVKSDLKEVEAIKQMQTPIINNKFLPRYCKYIFHYMPNISYLTSDLRGLLKKEALSQWSEVQDLAFQKIKII